MSRRLRSTVAQSKPSIERRMTYATTIPPLCVMLRRSRCVQIFLLIKQLSRFDTPHCLLKGQGCQDSYERKIPYEQNKKKGEDQENRLCALSLRNLVSGYECGKVFPAGVGPGSLSRDSANWLSSRLSRSAKTWRWYGWLRMVFSGARLFRAPIWCPSGGGGTREAWSTVAESLVALYRVGTHQIRRGGGQLDRRRTREVLNPCV